MTPGPTLEELIKTVHADALGEGALDRLAAASKTVSELEAVGDAVLGHFVDQCRRSGHSWSEISSALGVTKQAAHKRFSFAQPTFERFTERARSVLRAATEDARALGHNYVGTEHLLLGLFEPARGIAAQILGEIGITRAMVDERIRDMLPHGAAIGSDVPVPFTPRAAAALEQALTEALGLGHNYIGTEHLLLGLFGDAGSVASKILVGFGATQDHVRDAVIEKLSGYIKPTS